MHGIAAVPSITDFTVTDNPVIGSPFSIRCTAGGIPQPNISWRKDGQVLESAAVTVAISELQIVVTNNGRTSTVEVSEGSPELNGVYGCIAANVAGSATRSISIKLQGWLIS